jgi:hypothetical protein
MCERENSSATNLLKNRQPAGLELFKKGRRNLFEIASIYVGTPQGDASH